MRAKHKTLQMFHLMQHSVTFFSTLPSPQLARNKKPWLAKCGGPARAVAREWNAGHCRHSTTSRTFSHQAAQLTGLARRSQVRGIRPLSEAKKCGIGARGASISYV